MSDFTSEAEFRAKNAICPSCGRTYWQSEKWKLVCLSCYLKKGKASPARQQPAAAPAIPADMLKRLIKLAHPDKHNNSESATIATQWLLSLR